MPRAQRPNLETPASPFFGRVGELATLQRLLGEEHRLVTFVGPAGVGKTRLSLALAWALSEAPEFGRRVAFCDLSEAVTLDDLCASVVHALGIKGVREGGDVVVQRVGRHLERQGPTLLVLDNFEQLVDVAALAVGEWLRAAPEARFVVTSRLRLRLEGEYVHAVEPLPPADAEQLFLHRVGLVRPGYEVAPGDADVVREVLAGLDNLPLAIELAAARMQMMGIRELQGHLSKRLQLLSSGRRDAPPRQSSLEAALQWSWRQLEPWERSALMQCTRFRGGFDLAAVAAVVDLSDFDDAPATLDVLQALVDQSMVSARDLPAPLRGRRLSLLRTIRDFVSAQTSGDETLAAARRHAAHYADFGEHQGKFWDSHADGSALPRLRLERDNMLAAAHQRDVDPRLALRAALCLNPVVGTWGPFQPQLELLETLLAGAKELGLEPAVEARALVARGRMEMACLGVAAAQKSWSEGAVLAATAEDKELEGRARHGLAASAHMRGDLNEAVQAYDLALERLRDQPNRRAVCFALLDQAILHSERGSMDAALESVDEATATNAGDDLRGTVLALRGCIHFDTGSFELAHENLHAALDVSRQGDYRILEGQVLGELAVLELFRGEDPSGFGETIAVLEEVGDRRMLCAFKGYRGMATHLGGDFSAASRDYEETRRVANELGCVRLAGYLTAWSAMAYADLERLDLSRRRFEEAGADVDPAVDPLMMAILDLAHAQLELGRARESFAAGRAAHAATLLRAARSLASPGKHKGHAGRPMEDSSRDLRLSRRLFENALRLTAEQLGLLELAEESRVRLAVDGAGRWFRLDDEAAQDTGRRTAVRRLLLALSRAHAEAPGVPIARDELIAAVWAGEKMAPVSAKNRLHVALSQLRKLGMRDHILTEEHGYLLDPSIDLSIVDDEHAAS